MGHKKLNVVQVQQAGSGFHRIIWRKQYRALILEKKYARQKLSSGVKINVVQIKDCCLS